MNRFDDDLQARLAPVFIHRVRQIDSQLADICQRHLDEGYSLATAQAMLRDANKIAQVAQEQGK